jgi:hypothetical protein
MRPTVAKVVVSIPLLEHPREPVSKLADVVRNLLGANMEEP